MTDDESLCPIHFRKKVVFSPVWHVNPSFFVKLMLFRILSYKTRWAIRNLAWNKMKRKFWKDFAIFVILTNATIWCFLFSIDPLFYVLWQINKNSNIVCLVCTKQTRTLKFNSHLYILVRFGSYYADKEVI